MNENHSKIIYMSGPVSLKEFTTPRGTRVLLDMGGDAVLIIPRTRRGTYILTVQKRLGNEIPVYEFPSGGIKKGEGPEEAAARELLEETGAVGTLTFVTKVEPLSGLVKFHVYIFLADIDEISEEKKSLDEHEDVSTIELTREELLRKIKSLEMTDGYLLLGLGALEIF